MDLMRNSDEKRLIVKTSNDKNFIYIDISDTGCGISKEAASKLFSPEGSTVSFELGSEEERPGFPQLKLYKSYLLLNKYEVKMDVKSKVGKGTTFTMKIPYREYKTTR